MKSSVCVDLANAAEQFIPKKKFKSKKKIIDKTLSHLCWKSRVAYRNWNKAGRPFFGLTFEDVATHLNKCRARELHVRKKIQQRDELIAENHPNRFTKLRLSAPGCARVMLLSPTPRNYLIAGQTTSTLLESLTTQFSRLQKEM